MHPQKLSILLIATLGMSGTFLPWATVPFAGTISGTEGDGWVTFGLFMVAILSAVLGSARQPLRLGLTIFCAMLGVAAGALGLYEITQLNSLKKDNPFGQLLSVGAGLYVIIVAGFLLVLLAVLLGIKRRRTPNPFEGAEPATFE